MARKNKKFPRRLLVIRNSAMGDVAMLPHALRALQEAYPEVDVTVATRPMFRPFFADLGVRMLDVDVKDKHHSLTGMWRLAAEARKMGVDAVADMHGVLRSMAFSLSMRLHGVRVRSIHKGRISKWMHLKSLTRDCTPPVKHTVTRYCDVLRKLGYNIADSAPLERCPRLNPMGEKQGVWVGFAPFSAQRSKTYPESQSREVVRLLSERFDRVFIHTGGGAEAAFAEEMERAYPNVTALWQKVKLAQEIDLIANLDCIVSMDSMAMHLAALTATPVVSIWGATHPALGFLGYGVDPRGILQADMPCRPCSVYGKKLCKFGDYRCLQAISPEAVVERVAELTGR